MHNSINDLFDGLWHDYISITPSAAKIHRLICQHTGSQTIVNDHIALRTFNLPKVSLNKLSNHFLNLGYVQQGDYDFKAKKLSAQHFEHPNPQNAKVFISELRVHELSDKAQEIINDMLEQLDPNSVSKDDFLYSGTHWNVSSVDYKSLLEESEYAAWMAAWGYRANHFTVSINHLNKVSELSEINNLLKNNAFVLNSSGGEIKGGADVYLAQSSTMADIAERKFSDKSINIPSCFYEFAQRYKLENGEYYQGFVAASADKIFESTNANQ